MTKLIMQHKPDQTLLTETQTFEYDAVGRLTSATGTGAAAYDYDYSYHPDGNIQARVNQLVYPPLARYYNYDLASGHAHAVQSISGSMTASYSYDANGNMTGRVDSMGTYVQTFDVENRLVGVTQNGQTTAFAYDADGNRILTVLPNGVKLYTPFPDYEETVPTSGATTQRTTYALAGQLIAVRVRTGTTGNGVFYYAYTDHLGNVVGWTNASGVMVGNSLARYEPFGTYRTKPASSVNPDISDLGFTGHRQNNTGAYDLGLIYMNARYYLPEVGRFISADSIVPNPENPQSYNRYGYALNSPVNFTDPTGHKECGSKSDCGDPLPRWQSSIIIQSSNVIASRLPVPADAMPSDWHLYSADYAQLFPSAALKPTAPSGHISIYYGSSTSDIRSLLDFEIIARVLLAENLRLFLFTDPTYAKEVREHWPQDAIAMNYIIIHNAARAHQTVAEYVGPNQTANPLFNLSESTGHALNLAYVVALGVDQGWLDDPSFGADWYFQQEKNSTDGYLDNTLTGDWVAGTNWEPNYWLGRIVHPFEKWSSSPSPYQ